MQEKDGHRPGSNTPVVTARKRIPKIAPTIVCEFPTLESVTRPTVDTASAAHYLNRQPHTLHVWAMRDGRGPIKPVRIAGRLAWPVSELRRLLGVPAP